MEKECCRIKYRLDENFCKLCGSWLERIVTMNEDVELKKCGTCSKYNDLDALFCSGCGSKKVLF